MLASDIGNPDYVGSSNPDEKLFVEFYMHEPEDPNKSSEFGKRVRGPATPYVRIQVPGDKTTIIETPVYEEHKRRWPQKWLYFQIQNGMMGGEAQIPGWKLEDWKYLNEDQVRELKYMRFTVVEQVAGASDAQVQKLGMSGMALREEAKKALRERAGAEFREELESKEREIAALKIAQAESEKKAKEQEDRLARLEAAMMAAPISDPKEPVSIPTPASSSAETPPPKKRGRPKKQPEQVSG